jgi:hypothetical protein
LCACSWGEFSVEGIPVLAADRGGEAFVVDGEGDRASNASSFLSLFLVEGSPLRPFIR